MKKFKTVVAAALLSAFVLSSCGGSKLPYLGPTMDVVNTMSSLGISPEQAIGGIGALMTLTKGKLSPADWAKVAGAVPYSSTLMKNAVDMGVPSSISDLAGLNKVMGDLEIPSNVASQMTPMLIEYAGKKGGDDVVELLSGALLK